MDCKYESEVRTLLRIEVILIQGLLQGLLFSLITLLAIPFSWLPVAHRLFRNRRGRMGTAANILCIPLWMLCGVIVAVVMPFGLLFKTFIDLREVAKVEWETRWMTGKPKKPNGKPMRPLTDEEREEMEAEITRGVIEDYADEIGLKRE
jgi:hypothetical protein